MGRMHRAEKVRVFSAAALGSYLSRRNLSKKYLLHKNHYKIIIFSRICLFLFIQNRLENLCMNEELDMTFVAPPGNLAR